MYRWSDSCRLLKTARQQVLPCQHRGYVCLLFSTYVTIVVRNELPVACNHHPIIWILGRLCCHEALNGVQRCNPSTVISPMDPTANTARKSVETRRIPILILCQICISICSPECRNDLSPSVVPQYKAMYVRASNGDICEPSESAWAGTTISCIRCLIYCEKVDKIIVEICGNTLGLGKRAQSCSE